MKHLVLGLVGVFLASASFAQSTEFSLHLTSGLGAFRGPGAIESTAILVPDDGMDDYVYLRTTRDVPYSASAYGRKAALTYGGAAQLQRVTKGKAIWGVQAGYEMLRSRARVFLVFDQSDAGASADGKTIINSQAGNVHPFVGYRFRHAPLAFDLTAGPEVAFLFRSHEDSRAKSEYGTTYTTSLDRAHPTHDVRARLNLTAYYQRAGLSVGYSYGLTNYQPAIDEVYDDLRYQMLRVGLSYRLTGS
ncbi:hypothetical protein [Hymenobacter sp. BT190]|uniref:hypothetical protein n=1 Tax=Hymenobacter sp. BT190 TaxID=2763505 RepID=UPI001650FD7B|nr:hypothetical protein [Hymenobacter sp. BT190]MBC6696560.1 hypothetical protein [Hymenobacter sp. BT190]